MTHRVLESYRGKISMMHTYSQNKTDNMLRVTINLPMASWEALGHMMYSYTLPIPLNQRVCNKSSKEHNKTV